MKQKTKPSRNKLKKSNKKLKIIFNEMFEHLTPIFTAKTKEQQKDFLLKYQSSDDFVKYLNKMSVELAKELTSDLSKEWRKEYDELSKVQILPPFAKFEKDLLEKVTKITFKKIKSIPQNILKLNEFEYVKTLQDQVLKGIKGREDLVKLIKKLGSKYSKVVARTEASRLRTAVVQHRAQELESPAYRWISSNDIRTRKSHKKMYNVIVLWTDDENEKPLLDKMHGNAGELPNCRCSPAPIYDEDDLPSGAKLKIYNPEVKKVGLLTRKAVINKLFWNAKFNKHMKGRNEKDN